MALTRKDVLHVAMLARLSLDEKEIETYQKQLSEIIRYVQKLQELDTKNIEPTSQVTNRENVFREDTETPSLFQKSVLSQAKVTSKNYFKVDALFEE